MIEDFQAMIGANIREFTAKIKQVDSAVKKAATGAQVDVTADIIEFQKKSAQVSKKVKALEQRKVEIPVGIDTRDATSRLRALEYEMRNMRNEMKLANKKAMLPFKIEMMQTEGKMFKLAQTMGNFSGTTKEFMGNVQQLGAEYKKTSDNMINANKMIGASMIQQAGMMMNMTTQAQRISENYTRMANPLYNVNKAGLAVADTMNKIANNGNAAVLSLKMLGPNASMKQLRDMQMMINQGLMRFQMVALGAAVTSAFFYGTLHNAAMQNEEYANSFETMLSTIKQAFQPMIDVFTMVMTKIYDFVTAIGQMIIKFNEAHPTLAKLIQGVMMLVPALTLLLSPLAIGIGLLGGMAAAWNSIWMLIGPLITGLAAMSATVWVVAAAIVGLVAGITYLWRTNEGFRNAVVNAWTAIKAKAVEVFGMLSPLIDKVAEGFKNLGSAIVSAIQGDFSQLTSIFAQIVPSLIGFLVGGIPGIIISASRFIPAIAQGITSNAGQLSTTIQNVVNVIVTFLTTQVPIFLQQGVQIITSIVQGIATALPLIATAFVNIVTMIVPIIAQMLPVLIQAGIQIINALIQGITTILPVLIETFVLIITTLVQTIATALPQLLEVGIQILTTLIDGIMQVLPVLIETGIQLITQFIGVIVQNIPIILDSGIKIVQTLIDGIVSILPTLIDTALQLITTIVDTIANNLPKIIDAGIEILMSLIDGIIKILPQLIDTAIKLIETIVKMIVDNLPKIIDSGVKILNSLVDGIVKTLPKLIDTAVKLIVEVVKTLISNLPKIIDSGVKILTSLVDGIIKTLPKLITAAIKLITEIVKTIVSNLPKVIEAGGKILKALTDGIVQLVGSLLSAVKSSVLDPLVETVKGKASDMLSAGKDLINGLIDGIKNMSASAINAITGVVGGVVEKAKSLLKIKSPSRVFREIGGFVSEGLGIGVAKMAKSPIGAIENVATAMTSAFNPQLSLAGIDYAGFDIGNQMDELKRQIKQELEVDLWVHQAQQEQTSRSNQNNGDLVFEIDGYELARIQRPHLDGLNGSHTNLTLFQKGLKA